ncbi:MAG: hypothetical protein JRE10_15190 [Deltaproteobacteria bacterium]|nr:hypothetical protein [Deltaproteobacteria bacterium]
MNNITPRIANILILDQISRDSKISPRIRGVIASAPGDFSMRLMRKKRSLLWWQLLIEATLTYFLITCPVGSGNRMGCSPARSCPRPLRLAWLASELAMAGGSVSKKTVLSISWILSKKFI